MLKEEVVQYLSQWLAGNEDSFNGVLKHYYRTLMPTCSKFVSNKEDAEELVMNVLLKIWQNKSRFQGVSNIDDYIYGMLRQEITLLSRKKVIVTLDISKLNHQDEIRVEHPELTYKDLLKCYQEAINKLTPKQREIFLMIKESGFKRSEIAKITGLSIHTINNHMSSALKLLRQELDEYPDILILTVAFAAGSRFFLH